MSELAGRYSCNLCKWSGDAFLKRDSSLVCPRCFSRQRHRSIYNYLTENNLLSGNACLDIASRRILKHKINYEDYITIDIVPGRADYTMDVCNLKFDDNSFDLIICCSVLQFVPEYICAIQEMERVLKQDGTCIIQIPYETEIDTSYVIESDVSVLQNNYRSINHAVCFAYNGLYTQLKSFFNVSTFQYNNPEFEYCKQDIFICRKNIQN